MNPVPLYTNDYFITSSDVDFKRLLKMSRLFDFFQDIASQHAENLGGSVEMLRDKHNVAWVLMRMRVEIDEIPKLHDKITIETWPQKARAIFERDYVVKDSKGNVVVRATSNWVILSIEKREIVREKLVNYLDVETLSERAIDKKMGKLKPPSGLNEIYKKEIRYSDIDYNGHINNARYVDFIMDCIPVSKFEKENIKAIEVHYLNEAGSGEAIALRAADFTEDGNVVFIDAVSGDDERVIFNSTVEFE